MTDAGSKGLPWVEKYRPRGMNDLLGHEDVVKTIDKLVGSGNMPHLLLYGPPGTGKTSTILAAARKLYGDSYTAMVLELNASDERGIDVVRNQIKEFASSKKLFSSGLKLIVLDEADAMTNAAQSALRRIVEKYTKWVRFCIICNHINKIIPAIQSRCTRFRFGPLAPDAVKQCIKTVSAAEHFEVAPEAVEALVAIGKGDMRRVLNVLQATWMSVSAQQNQKAREGDDAMTDDGEVSPAATKLEAKDVYESTGHPTPDDVRTVLSTMLSESLPQGVQHIQQIQQAKGLALQDIISELLPYVLRLGCKNQIAKMHVIDKMATVEASLAAGSNERLQLGALVAAFQELRLSC